MYYRYKDTKISFPFTHPETGVRYPAGWFDDKDDLGEWGLTRHPDPVRPEFDQLKQTLVTLSSGEYGLQDIPIESQKQRRLEQLESFISSRESETLLARPTREFMLTLFELEAVKAGLTSEQLALVNPGYAKVKALDVEITAARDEIRTLSAELAK
jgi:hypothetical protein